jgi:hypothetical protein
VQKGRKQCFSRVFQSRPPWPIYAHMSRILPASFVAPCLPSKADKLPSNDLWLHEIKHDGFRIIARKRGSRVKL